jgi:glycosyltransferase involved in cell wall biosynthesis
MGTVAFNQARALASAGIDVTVFTRRQTRPRLRQPGVDLVELPALVAKGNAACLPQVLWRTGGFDLIHLHYPFFGTAELLAARRLLTGPPIVLQYQMDVVGEGWLAHFFRWHRRLLFPLILRAADGVVVTTSDYAAASSFLGPKLATLRSKVAVIPPGVDLGNFSPGDDPHGWRRRLGFNGGPLIFFLSRLDRAHYFKGLHVLFEALQALPEAGLVVGGDGDLRVQYEAQAEALGLRQRVQFAGEISDEALPAYYRAADVVVLPSVDRTEAFGLVLLEAMACGKPVVASRLPGVRTLVEEGQNGYLVEPGNAADLADKLRRCIQDGPVLGAHARQAVEARFSWPIIAEQLVRLYGDVLNRSETADQGVGHCVPPP